jgi:hypothetical protein
MNTTPRSVAVKNTQHRVPPMIRAMILERARVRCELHGGQLVPGGYDPHHRKQRSTGGHDEAFNLLAVCRRCHDMIHADMATALRNGWIVPSWGDPANEPVLMHDGRYLLDGLGGLTVLDQEPPG